MDKMQEDAEVRNDDVSAEFADATATDQLAMIRKQLATKAILMGGTTEKQMASALDQVKEEYEVIKSLVNTAELFS